MQDEDKCNSAGFYHVMSTGRLQRQAGAIPMWLLIGLGLLGGILLYWYTTPQEAPAWVRDRLPGMPEYTGALYRWRNSQGQWQVTDKPPQNRPYEVVRYRSDANVMPAKEQ